MPTSEKTKTRQVTVEFPLSKRGPYHGRHDEDETIGVIRAAAMEHFGAVEDPSSKYYLTGHDGEPIADETPLGDGTDKPGAVKLTLVKELIQG